MKIVSVVVFAAAMLSSWFIVHSQRPVAESVHAGIQSDLKRIIAEYVQKTLPESKNLRFHRFYTENVNTARVRAFFKYSFEDTTNTGEAAEVILEGSAVLNKTGESADVATWSFDELKILGNTVNFSEPIQIISGSEEIDSEDYPQDESENIQDNRENPEDHSH